MSWICNCRLARPITRTGIAFHCNKRPLLLLKPIYEFGTYHWCPPSKVNFWESKSWCSLWGEATKAVDSENLSFLMVGATQGRQTHTSKTTLGMVSYWWERLQGWFQIHTLQRIFQWQLCFRETVSFPSACQEKHGPSHLATLFDHPPPFLANGLTHSLCCWPKGIQLRKH